MMNLRISHILVTAICSEIFSSILVKVPEAGLRTSFGWLELDASTGILMLRFVPFEREANLQP